LGGNGLAVIAVGLVDRKMPHSKESAEKLDTGLACLVIMARFYGFAADAQQLTHQFAVPGQKFTDQEILRACKSIGLKSRATQSPVQRISKIPLPAIAKHQDGHYFIIAKYADDKVLIQDPLEKHPQTLPLEMLEQAWTGELILITQRASILSESQKFGFKWFIPAIIKHKKLLTDVLVASCFLQLFALVTPLFFQVVMDKVLVHKGFTTLDVLTFGLLVVILFEVVLGGLRTYLFSHTTNRIDVSLGAKLFNHLMALPLSYFEARRVGDSVARVRELENIRNFITGSALTLLIDFSFTFIFIAVMYYYSPVLTWIVLGSIPFYILLSIWVTPILWHRLNEKFARGAENQAFLVESVSGIETIKSLAVEPQMQRNWDQQLAGYVSSSFESSNLNNIASQIASFISKLVTVLIIWKGAHLVIEGALTVGQLVAFNMLAGRVSGPVLKIVQLWQDFQQAGISIDRLGDILNTRAEPGYNPNRSTLPKLQGNVKFDHVTFRYNPDGVEVLKDINLEINSGEVIGIVGRSGSGKSTLTKLLQRLYVPEGGRVLVDGVDLGMVDTSWLRRNLGVVLQENFLFNRSVRANIALADPGLPMEAIIQSAKLAGAHDFILELPEGYDSKIEEHGANLSGGQKQRIAIARALVTNPKILIFDEATSALDYESEHIIQNNMQAICQGRTVFIIAHRLSAVRRANRIIVMDKGHIVEQGNHKQLIKLKGYYAKLYQYQQGENIIPGNISISASWQQGVKNDES
jgi:subfamily B ATP-binding cassette protein HlyB/CyaB